MKKNLNLIATFILFIITGCQKDVQTSTVEKTAALSKAEERSAPGIQTVYLSVTVEDDAAHINMVRSDNEVNVTPYLHGKDRVEAQVLSSDGNFYMNTNNNTVKSPIRTMQFLPGSDVVLSGKRNYSLRTSAPLDEAINNGNTKWIQNLAVGESQLMSFRAWGVQQQGMVDWKLLFRNGPENNSSSLTDYVRVTKTASNPDTWTIEPAQISANAKLTDANNNPMGSGYYQVPFKLKLTKVVK